MTDNISEALSWLTEGTAKPGDALQSGGEGQGIRKRRSEATEADEGLRKLQRKVDQKHAERLEVAAIYKQYQDNIKACNMLQTEIAKGIKAGENIYKLFLKAAEALSRTVGDRGYYKQIEADLLAIYGNGLGEPGALEIELEQTQTRLTKLTAAEQRETEPTEKDRIQRAIVAHKKKVKEIEDRMK